MEIIINNGIAKFKNLELVGQCDVTDSTRIVRIEHNFVDGEKYVVSAYCEKNHRVFLMMANTMSGADIYQYVLGTAGTTVSGAGKKEFIVKHTVNTEDERSPINIALMLGNNTSTDVRKCLKLYKIVE